MRLLFLLALLFSAATANCQPEGVLYGTLTLDDDKTITGAMRWNDRAQYWLHHISGEYAEPFDLDSVSDEVADAITEHQPGPQLHINDDVVIEFVKWFSDEELQATEWRFPLGVIDAIDLSDDDATVTLSGGHQFSARKSGMLSRSIEIRSSDGEIREYEPSDVREIRFSEAPEDAQRFPDFLFGTLTADDTEYTGLIEWDQDERGLTEELDGDLPDGEDLSIEFGDIARIVKVDNDASTVHVKSGKSYVLNNSNDVDSENRGNVVHDRIARRIFNWARFTSLEFQPIPDGWLPTRSDFAPSTVMHGKVERKDAGPVDGQLYLDLSHDMSSAVTSTEYQGLRMFVPLGAIREVRRTDGRFGLTLKDGTVVEGGPYLFAGPSTGGVLVRSGSEESFVPWDEITSIAMGSAGD